MRLRGFHRIGLTLVGVGIIQGLHKLATERWRRSRRCIRMAPTTSDPATTLVAPLEGFGRDDLQRAGGKGANLGELTRAGFPVPPGFVVTTSAYDVFLDRSNLRARIDAVLAAIRIEDLSTLERASRVIQEAFLVAPIPQEVAEAVLAAYHTLGGAVAVRSSATAEDLPEAAFAGQQETYLNVIGDDALLQAVRSCWASLWTERAIVYRRRQGFDQATVKLAVVIQRMIPAEVGGVMFTTNPITGVRREIVIDASPGLGEAVVAGLVTPDHFVVDKRRFKLMERRAGRREVVLRAGSFGGIEQSAAEADLESPLSAAAIRDLAKLGAAVERHYGMPQDIEWAWASGAFFLLQTRPMTGLPEPVQNSARERRMAIMAAERMPIRPYPLDVSSYTSTFIQAVLNAMMGPFGVSIPSMEQFFVEEDGVVVRFGGMRPRLSPRMLYMPWLSFWRSRRYDAAHWEEDPILAEAQHCARQLEARALQSLPWPELLSTLHQALELVPCIAELRRRYFPRTIPDFALLWLILRLIGQNKHFDALISGVDNKTLEMNRALERLASQIRAEPALHTLFATTAARDLPAALANVPAARGFLDNFQAFLLCYGYRETVQGLASQPTWKNAPEVPLGVLKGLAAAEPRPTGSTAPAWQRARDQVLATSVLGRAPLRGFFVRLLERARRFPQLREDTHFYLALALPTVHACFLELGNRLVDVGALGEPTDVLHLKLAEIEAAGDHWPPPMEVIERWRAIVTRRKAKREALAGRPLLEAQPLLTTPIAGHALVAGTPGSPGLAEGRIRIIRTPTEFEKLQPGDILVAPYTDPAWTPLFQRAAAVIADSGGASSHAAIVAREYGVPAIMGTFDGTRRLEDGQSVLVDGNRGLVFAKDGPSLEQPSVIP